MALRGNACIGQSGGPTAVINATMVGAVEAAREIDEIEEFYGALHGLQGILDEDLIDLFREDPDVLNAVRYAPSAAIGSVRLKPKEEHLRRVMAVFRAHDIRYLFYNGGNDSQFACHLISELAKGSDWEMKIIGVPKTIDNDLVELLDLVNLPGSLVVTDHCPGYGSAARFAAASVQFVAKDSEAFGNPHVVEVMGRHAGWLTGATGVGAVEPGDAPHLVYVPEAPVTREQFLDDVASAFKQYGTCVVAVSEGFKFEGAEEFKASDRVDSFGHARLGGVAQGLADLIEEAGIAKRCRNDKLGNLQRCFGWAASATDLEEAYAVGREAVIRAARGETDVMITIERESDQPYRWECGVTSLVSVADQTKSVPLDWLNEATNGLGDEMRRYVTPLIRGRELQLEAGVPRYPKLRKHFVEKRLPPFALSHTT